MKTRRNSFVGITLPLVVLLLPAVNIARPIGDPPDQREIRVTARRFEFSPKTITVPEFDPKVGQLTGFKNDSEVEIAFGFEKRIGRHVFSLTFSNTQTTTTARRDITRATRLFRRASSALGSTYSGGYCDRSVRST